MFKVNNLLGAEWLPWGSGVRHIKSHVEMGLD